MGVVVVVVVGMTKNQRGLGYLWRLSFHDSATPTTGWRSMKRWKVILKVEEWNSYGLFPSIRFSTRCPSRI